ncbi:microtubule-associated serine/threonine-protein kinase 3-like [Thunnus maccoyii]|uniref:microtubule-associated serine/threonine-protein kinase 3-like n=1 Tax=Thunnus maccoyii TaxID=8240 RepID=UPI001C4B43B1|nr:microtubule-associated serine/threonine-protein kinase 3-like [Thunnus maccoyii]
MELQNKMEKLLHETPSACSPPLRKPVESNFETVKWVSGGCFGSVNLVHHKLSSQAFAMRVIKWQNLTNKIQNQQVLVERDVLAFAESPYIVSMFCSFKTQMDLRIIIEYIAGGCMYEDVCHRDHHGFGVYPQLWHPPQGPQTQQMSHQSVPSQHYNI